MWNEPGFDENSIGRAVSTGSCNFARHHVQDMVESIVVQTGFVSKAEKYSSLLPQINYLVASETDLVANLGNVAAALKEVFGFLWIGFYFVKDEELVLGPFQGPVACTRIGFGKGVCGTAWKENRIIRVDDVDTFPGHIACSSLSRSEIVMPALNKNGDVFLVLDIDSENLGTFDETDEKYLGDLMRIIEKL